MKVRQVTVDGLPDNLQIDLEIPMRERIAHFAGDATRQLRTGGGVVGMIALDVATCFAR